MKNPTGLIKIETGGSAFTTSITIDGVTPVVSKCVITIEPNDVNQIVLHCMTRQKNGTYEDGEVQTYCGISKENYEFFTGLMKLISEVPDDDDLADRYPSNGIPVRVMEVLEFIYKSRHQGQKTDEQAPEQP